MLKEKKDLYMNESLLCVWTQV